MINNGTYFLWEKDDPIDHLSPNFSTSEFTCHCKLLTCKQQMISVSLIAKLEHVRAASGPLDITSGYRCPEYQELLTKDPSVETVLQSQHTLGHAADICLANSSATLFQFSNLLQECGKYFLAIGQGRRFLHVDERVDKVRRWYYSY